MGDAVGGEVPRYRAFISYSHRDAGFGRRLHRWLEGYAPPRRLVGQATPMGPVPARLAPIFRDREELPAAHDLTQQVRAALAESGALVVVCSPAAAASPWVAREIEAFRALHPHRPILAALIAGEPAEAFPAALLGPAGAVEPLAADFRAGGDGRRPALLKLVAGIVGLGLDQLVQRDAQRQMRRVTAVTAGAVAAMLAMGLLTLFALDARAQAERQRREAEGLVEFMLTDLRDRLEGVGRLDVLTVVNRRALAHYAGQELDRLPPEALERRARILHAMGEDDERRGDMERALAQFQEARRTTAALLAAAPNDPDRIFTHAQSEYWVAFIDWRQGRFEAAEAGFRRYAALAEQLLAADPDKPEWRMEAGYAETNLGTLALRDKGDAAAARDHFLATLRHFDAAARARPGDPEIRRMQADTQAWLADSQRALGLHNEARASREHEAALLRGLQAEDPRNAVYARDLLGNALGLAQIDLAAGRAADARARLATAHAQAGRLAAADPDDRKMAMQKIALGLFLARATVAADGRAGAARTSRLLADCGSAVARGDQELRDLCAVTAAGMATAQGRTDPAASAYLAANQQRMASIRRSPRWGVDFTAQPPTP